MATSESEKKMKKIKQGGMRTMPFILVNEVFDRFATAGFNANMITYLTQQLHMPLVEASNTLTNFAGTSSMTPIIGALIADSFAGRFWTITLGSIFYQLGMISLTLSAVLPGLHPPRCSGNQTCREASKWQLLFLYGSLLLTSIGSGGIRPCVVAFGADQLSLNDPNPNTKRWSFFNLYFFSMGISTLLPLTVVVYIQENIGWGWGLGIPTIGMFFSVVVFVIGYPLYIKLKPGGSPLTRLAQVVVAAFRKRKAPLPSDPNLLYQDKELDADISVTGRLLHTDQLKFFDRAAVVREGDMLSSGMPKLWRLSTVHRVEELKSIIRMMPIWVVGILLVTAASHNHTFAIQQARSMDRHLWHSFEIPAASMSIFTVFSMLLTLAFYDQIFVPVARRFTGKPSGITYLQRLGIGLSISVTANVAAALVEVRRKAVAAKYGFIDQPNATIPLSVFWLIPQYSISGIAEAFMSVAHMEFLYDQSPESMRSTAAALFWLAVSTGNYMGTLLVTLVNDLTKKKGDWLQNNINKGKLDYYYWLVTGLQVLNLAYYVLCASFYKFKPLEVAEVDKVFRVGDEEGGGNGDVELAGVVDMRAK
ncbi:Proton-dependent oligopeptide transporter family protein [Dioscorea alata]|uniref:Proton-dependent oligopeptide transporter family protein n=1 Tax=Dioscorea alata TaxID=55571 RepID=A0ACB7VRL2_DIOAL|nr:Proton-dependent oligopeptide transporter family protein [Dioscorea alata]